MQSTDGTAVRTAAETRYFTVWRWHFYAALYVFPFLVMLALTGLVMMWTAALWGRDGERLSVAPAATSLPVPTLQTAAVAAVGDGAATAYLEPLGPDKVALFRVAGGSGDITVAINPYTADILDASSADDSWYKFANDIHGTLLVGTTGDRLIEIGASLGIVMLVSGLWLHWPRDGAWRKSFMPALRLSSRGGWKALHGAVGLWASALGLFFLVTGLSWSGVWGEKLVQAWSTFPAEKWEAVPLSDKTHASMNHDSTKEVPWGLEQTPIPESGSMQGAVGVVGPVTLDSVATFARTLGFDGRFQIAIPQEETDVWTISHDSMSKDGPNPLGDRTLHIDRYTGKVLADVRFKDYSLGAKAMAAGVALHEGDTGLWNLILNTVFCLSMIILPVSGLVMWWKRRPAGAGRLAAPPAPQGAGFWWGGAAVIGLLGLAFPLGGAAMLAIVVIDRTLLRWTPTLRQTLS